MGGGRNMTQATYLKHTEDYVGKHAPREYVVQAIRNAGSGFIETFYIAGINNVRDFIHNGSFFDWRVSDSAGKIVDPKYVIYGGK